jgi:hypothetical protein
MNLRFFALVLLASAVPAQESRPPSGAATRPAAETRPAPPPHDPAALELFRKAAADQTSGDASFAVRDFQADLNATLYERGQDGNTRSRTADVTEFWRAPKGTDRGRYRRDLFEPAERKTTVHGFDGQIYWEKLGTAPARELKPREDQETLRRLREEMRRMNDLTTSILLRSLDVPAARWSMLPDVKTFKTNDGELPARGVRRDLPDARVEEFYFGTKTLGGAPKTVLLGYRRPRTETAPEDALTFASHALADSGGTRVIVPLVVDTYENGARVLTGRARDVKDVKFNVGLEDALFSPPRR